MCHSPELDYWVFLSDCRFDNFWNWPPWKAFFRKQELNCHSDFCVVVLYVLKVWSFYRIGFCFSMPTSDNSDVVVEVRRSLLCPLQHRPHHGPGPLLPPLCPHSYTAQLPPLDPPEATTSVVWLNQYKPSMQWRGYKPTTLSSEGICAYAQPLLAEGLNLSSWLIHAMMGIWTHGHLIRGNWCAP